MKRNTFFLAVFLIAGGLLLMLKNVLGLRFASFPALFALGMIVLGIYLMTNMRGFSTGGGNGQERMVLFGSQHIVAEPGVRRYTIVFSSVVIEMPPDPPPILEVTSLFSSTVIKLAPGHATRIILSAAFGSAAMPGFRLNGFGEHEQFYGAGPASYMTAAAVFGSMSVE